MKKILIVYFILIVISSCQFQDGSDIITIDSFEETSNAAILIDFFYSAEIIPLNFEGYFYDNNMLLTYKEFGNLFAIQDWNKSIRVFDRSGKIQTTISAIGRGPGEYSVIDDFIISPENRIKVLCDQERILSYSLSGNFLKEDRLDFAASNFTIYNDSSYIFWAPRYSETKYGTDRVIVADKDGNVVNSFLPLFSHAVAYGTAMTTIQGDNLVLCRQYHDPNIYIIDNKGIVRTYNIDFKSKALSDKFIHSRSLDEAAEEMQTMQAYYISTAYENDKSLMMTIVYQDKFDSGKGAYWLFDKKSRKSKICFYDMEDEVFKLLGYPLYMTADGRVIFVVATDNYNRLKEKYPIFNSNTEYCNTSYLLIMFHLKKQCNEINQN